jgi:hypothetical protein
MAIVLPARLDVAHGEHQVRPGTPENPHGYLVVYPVVSVSDTLDPDHFLVGFFSALTDRVPSVHVSAGARA